MRRSKGWLAAGLIVLLMLGIGLAIFVPAIEQRASTLTLAGDAKRGENLLKTGGCYACHTNTGDSPVQAFAGGPALETGFGTFVAPNITSSRSSGIGDWTLKEFDVALRQGIRPDGQSYYPTFPFLSYRSLTDQDTADLFAALQATEPVDQAADQHELSFPYSIRASLKPWRWLFASTRSLNIDQSTEIGRGRYLVDALAHCGECHTPRNSLGAFIPPYMGGNDQLPGGDWAPPIHGRALARMDWNELDMMYFLADGMLPDGDFVGGSMVEVIDHGTAYMSEEDRKAIAEFLFSLQ